MTTNDFTAVRVGSMLRAADDVGSNIMSGLTVGEPIMVSVKQSRNIQQHIMYWALITIAHNNLPEKKSQSYPRKENLSDAVKIAAGLVDQIIGLDGKVFLKPRSIAFDKMDQVEFNNFFSDALRVIVEQVIPGLNSIDIMQEVLDIVK